MALAQHLCLAWTACTDAVGINIVLGVAMYHQVSQYLAYDAAELEAMTAACGTQNDLHGKPQLTMVPIPLPFSACSLRCSK